MSTTTFRSVCVFLGSFSGNSPVFADAARALGKEIAQRGLTLVYGGSSVGLMEILASTVLAHRGTVVGVIPQALVDKEVARAGLSETYVVGSMHERKAKMAELADGFIALPGGLGTLEELFEVFTWAQLGFHGKPLGLLDGTGYYDKLLEFLDGATEEGFIKPQHRAILMAEADPARLLDRFAAYEPGYLPKWIKAKAQL